MEHTRELALRTEAAGLMRPSRECLPDVGYSELVRMVDQLRRAFPHQDLGDSLEMLTRGFEILAVRYGLRMVRDALETLLVEPGRRFFPLVGELSEALSKMRQAERRRILRENPFTPCGRCDDGILVVREKDGPVSMRDCGCRIAWRRRISTAAGEEVTPADRKQVLRMPSKNSESRGS